MSRAETLRSELAKLAKEEASLQSDVAKHSAQAGKHSAEASKRYEAARKTKSPSSQSNAIRQAQDNLKKAADAEKKLAATRKKLSDVAGRKAAKEKALAAAEKSDRDKISRQTARDRKADIGHVNQLAALRARALRISPPKPEALRVLYLTTNPDARGDGSLRTDVEFRSVQNELRGTKYRDLVDIRHLPAATYEDMLHGMNDYRPHVIHFSGHGGGRECCSTMRASTIPRACRWTTRGWPYSWRRPTFRRCCSS